MRGTCVTGARWHSLQLRPDHHFETSSPALHAGYTHALPGHLGFSGPQFKALANIHTNCGTASSTSSAHMPHPLFASPHRLLPAG